MRHGFLASGAIACSALALMATAANAAPVITAVGTNFAGAPVTFGFGGATFTLSATGDFTAPTAVRTGGTGQFNTFFGSPTTNFVNRGTVTFGPTMAYAAFPTATPIRFSNGDNFFGLRALQSDGTALYGFAFTTNNVLNSFGFESVANTAITATVNAPAAVPEPATWAMMIMGFGAIGYGMRRRSAVRFAAAA